jgi:hypothetical protein
MHAVEDLQLGHRAPLLRGTYEFRKHHAPFYSAWLGRSGSTMRYGCVMDVGNARRVQTPVQTSSCGKVLSANWRLPPTEVMSGESTLAQASFESSGLGHTSFCETVRWRCDPGDCGRDRSGVARRSRVAASQLAGAGGARRSQRSRLRTLGDRVCWMCTGHPFP